MGSRPPLRGFNHNLKYRKRVYHVQTEDSGLTNPHVFTHVFHGGVIIQSSRKEYAHLVEQEGHEQDVRKMMQEQHKKLMKALLRGDLDPKIEQCLLSLDGDDSDDVAEEQPTPQAATAEAPPSPSADDAPPASSPDATPPPVPMAAPSSSPPPVPASVSAAPEAPGTEAADIVDVPTPPSDADMRPPPIQPLETKAKPARPPRRSAVHVPEDSPGSGGARPTQQPGVYKIINTPAPTTAARQRSSRAHVVAKPVAPPTPAQPARPVAAAQPAEPRQGSSLNRYTAPSARNKPPRARPGTGAYGGSNAPQKVPQVSNVRAQPAGVVATPPVIIGQRPPQPGGNAPEGTPQPNTPARKQPKQAPSSLFGGEQMSERSLDEVILQYLAEDETED